MSEESADTGEESRSIDRRRALQLLAGVSTAGLAGCGGGGDGGDGGGGGGGGGGDGNGGQGGGDVEHGERVPPIVYGYFTAWGGHSAIFEEWVPVMREGFEEIGVDMEIYAEPIAPAVGAWYKGQRPWNYLQMAHNPTPERVAESYLMEIHSMTRVDSYPSGSLPYGYPSCEYADAFYNQSLATDAEERSRIIEDGLVLHSHDKTVWPQAQITTFGAYDRQVVEPGGLGGLGMTFTNPFCLIKATHTEDGVIRTNLPEEPISSTNPKGVSGGGATAFWQDSFYSPLVGFDWNHEFQGVIADDWTIDEEGRTFTFELGDYTFHDGEPITAGDIDYSLNLYLDNPALGVGQAYANRVAESTEVIDEQTWSITWELPFLPFLDTVLPQAAILPEHIWGEEARENPEQFEPDPPVGSGPLKFEQARTGEFFRAAPHENHHYEANSRLYLAAYRDETAAIEAFVQGELDMLNQLSFAGLNALQNRMEDDDRLGESIVNSYGPYYCVIEDHYGPVMFEEFRDAVGTVWDRRAMNQLGLGGHGKMDTYSTIYTRGHPNRPPEERLYRFTDDLTGDAEAARQKLADAGWTWDDDGNLRYPVDADTSPMWPKGEPIPADQFECLEFDEDGKATYVPPDKR